VGGKERRDDGVSVGFVREGRKKGAALGTLGASSGLFRSF